MADAGWLKTANVAAQLSPVKRLTFTTDDFLRAGAREPSGRRPSLGRIESKGHRDRGIPAALQGIISGIMLDVARVAGETAPLLFTSFSNRFWSPGWEKPTASLPVMFFTDAIAPYDDWHRQAWAAGFVLLMLVLLINIIAGLRFEVVATD